MAAACDSLAGLRILVVEDELLVAMLVEEMLQKLGCTIIGPVSTLDAAVIAVRKHCLDGALLDANLNSKSSSAAADELLERGVPFLLVTGYGGRRDGDPPALKSAPRLTKPFEFDELANRMMEVFGRQRRAEVEAGP